MHHGTGQNEVDLVGVALVEDDARSSRQIGPCVAGSATTPNLHKTIHAAPKITERLIVHASIKLCYVIKYHGSKNTTEHLLGSRIHASHRRLCHRLWLRLSRALLFLILICQGHQSTRRLARLDILQGRGQLPNLFNKRRVERFVLIFFDNELGRELRKVLKDISQSTSDDDVPFHLSTGIFERQKYTHLQDAASYSDSYITPRLNARSSTQAHGLGVRMGFVSLPRLSRVRDMPVRGIM